MDQIILRAYHPSKNPEVVVCPLPERGSGNTFTGQGKHGYYELMTPKEKEELGNQRLITPQTKIKITNDHPLDMRNPVDKANWEWMKKHPYIDVERLDTPSRDAVFYVHNKEAEAQKRVTRNKRIVSVMGQIYSMSSTEKKLLAESLYLGDASGFSDAEIEDYLELQVKEKLSHVEKILVNKKENGNDELAAMKLYNEATNKGIIKKHRGGYIKYGGSDGLSLGRDQETCVQYLMDSQNEDTVVAIRGDLENLKS